MARKPLSALSPAYRRRIERAEAKGQSRQAARGHKPREHVERKRREERRAADTGALTSAQKQTIKRYLVAQARKSNEMQDIDRDELWELYGGYVEERGWAWFLRLRSQMKSYHQQYIRGGYKSMMTLLRLNMEAIDRNDAEGWMLYYH